MPDSVKGLELCEQFFHEIAKPILDRFFPSLAYSAGLLGYGSDVLGYDDVTSTDHMWGPRIYLFLTHEDIHLRPQIEAVFARNLPYTLRGYSVNFCAPDMSDGGVRVAEFIDSGEVSSLIFIHTIDEYLDEYLGTSSLHAIDGFDWLALSEHKLLGLTAGRLFVDALGMAGRLEAIRFYPDDVALYLIASQWSLIGEEQAFVKRCGQDGDDTGSRIICARIAERLMRLCFLYCRQYAPYSKWFGTAFGKLPIGDEIKQEINLALSANDLAQREHHLVAAQVLVAHLHNASSVTAPVEVRIQPYFGRDIQVIFADRIADAIAENLKSTPFEDAPTIGSLSQVGNFTAITDNPKYRKSIRRLYTD